MISRLIYTCLLHFLLPIILLRLWWRGFKAPHYRDRWLERLGFLTPVENTPDAPLWIHAVSVGEVQAVSTLVQNQLARHPNIPIIITTMTPTGADRVQLLFGKRVTHRYCPYDLPWALKRFIRTIKPRACLIVETELWPNFLDQCQRANIPVLLANARLSERSARGYARFPQLTKGMLDQITHLAAQGEADAERFKALGMPLERLSVTGSIKFDVPIQTAWFEQAETLKQAWGPRRPVLLAASTHADEEAQLLNSFPLLLSQQSDALLILVPRHPERFDEVAQLCFASGLEYQRRSAHQPISEEIQVYLTDTMGELMIFCAAADVVFVGGSLIERGGHNPLEPALLGKPVLCGQHTFNFASITDGLLQAGALVQISQAEQVMRQAADWFAKHEERLKAGDAAKAYVAKHAGALDRLTAQLEKLL